MDRVSMMMSVFSGWRRTVLLLGLFWALMPPAFAARHWSTGVFGFAGEGSETIQVSFYMSGSMPADKIKVQGGAPMIAITWVSFN